VDIQNAPMLVVGSHPEIKNYESLWRAFLAVAKENHFEFDKIYTEAGLIKLTLKDKTLKLPGGLTEIERDLANKQRVIVQISADSQMAMATESEKHRGMMFYVNPLVTVPKKLEGQKILAEMQSPAPGKFELYIYGPTGD
jgi:hypothetical protein